MEVKFNNQSIELAENTSVLAFVVLQVGDKQNGIAVAVNEAIVPKSKWGKTTLQANDNLLIIKATQGG
jgi:sulfur carrier protein